jgi:hypothetical protein
MHQQHTPADRQQDRPFHQPNRSYRGQCQRGQRRRVASGAQSVSDAPRGTFNPADDTRNRRASNGARCRARGVRGTDDDSPRDVRRTCDSPLSGVRRTGQGALRAFLDVHANSLAASLAARPSSQKVYPRLPSSKPTRNGGRPHGEITRPRRSVGSESQAEAEVAGHQGQPLLNLQLIAGVGDQVVAAYQRAQNQHRLVQSELPSDA